MSKVVPLAALLVLSVLFGTLSWPATGARPVRLLDDGSSPVYPACTAAYATQCSFDLVYRLVNKLSKELTSAANESAIQNILNQTNEQENNPQGAFGFSPYIFDATSNQLLANGRDIALNGMNMASIAKYYTVCFNQSLIVDRIAEVAQDANDGWFTFVYTSEDRPLEPVTHWGYASQITSEGTGQSFIVLSALAKRSLPRFDTDLCPKDVNRLCSIKNVRSLVGNALSRGMAATTFAKLRELWLEISYPVDTSLYQGHWSVFAEELHSDELVLASIYRSLIGLSHDEFMRTILNVSDSDELSTHQAAFANTALQGGGWVAFNFSGQLGVSFPMTVSFVSGFERFGVKYFVGSAFQHVRDPSVKGALCSTCSASTNAPCAIGNVATLSAHAEVELLISNATSEVFAKLANGEDFRMDGGFGILLVSYEEYLVESDSVDPTTIGGSSSAAFAVRGIDVTDLTSVLTNIRKIADEGGGWVLLPVNVDSSNSRSNAGYVAIVRKVTKGSMDFFLLTGYNHTRAPVDEACSAQYNAPCAEQNVKAIVGDVVARMQLASNIQSVLDDINAGELYVKPDFYPIVLNGNFELIAYGDHTDLGTWNISNAQDYMSFVQQVHAVSSLGSDFYSLLRDAAFEVGGGFLQIAWNEAASSSGQEQRNIFVLALQKLSSSGIEETYYVMSMFHEIEAPPVCAGDDDCPSNAYCVPGVGDQHAMCSCEFYYAVSYSKASDNQTCQSTPTVVYEMSCSLDADKTGMHTYKIIARFLGAVNVLVGTICMGWVFYLRKDVVIKAAQPLLLMIVALGAIISSSTLFAMANDDAQGIPADASGGNSSADAACKVQPWLYGVGFTLTYCAMIVKLQRVSKVFHSVIASKAPTGISTRVTISYLIGLLSVEVFLLLLWAVVSPVVFVRPEDNPYDGYCKSDSAVTFVGLLAGYHLILLLYGAYLSYVCRRVSGLFAETKYLSFAMLCNLQVLLVAIPLITLTSSSSENYLFLRSLAIFLNDLSTLGFIFGPKMYFCVYGTSETSILYLTKAEKAEKRSKRSASVSAREVGGVIARRESFQPG